MSKRETIEELQQILESLERIPRRFSKIYTPTDFTSTDEGIDRLDAICMMLLSIGEAFKRIDRKTEGTLLAQYPEIEWRGVKGVRNVIAHEYFDIDIEQVFSICKEEIPILISATRKMLLDLGNQSDQT